MMWIALLTCCIMTLVPSALGKSQPNWCSCEERNVTNSEKICEAEFVARVLVKKATSFAKEGKTVYKIKLTKLFRLPNKEREDIVDDYLITTCGVELDKNGQYLVSGRTRQYVDYLPDALKESGKEILAACKHEFIVAKWNSLCNEERAFLNNPDCTDAGGSN